MTRITQAFPGETELDRRASFEASQHSAVPERRGHSICEYLDSYPGARHPSPCPLPSRPLQNHNQL